MTDDTDLLWPPEEMASLMDAFARSADRNTLSYSEAAHLARNAAKTIRALAAPQALAATPAVGGELPAWQDAQVQIVYETVCQTDENVPPNPEEHWEGWMSRRIVAALRAAQPASPLRGRSALEPLARINLWQDKYPDGPDCISDHFLQKYFTPDEVRAARAALAQPEQPDHLVLDEFERLDGKFMQQIMLSDASELVREKPDQPAAVPVPWSDAEEGDMS